MSSIEIYEDKQSQQSGQPNWRDFMDDKQFLRGQYYSTKYYQRRAEVEKNKALWDRLSDLYACQRIADDQDPDYPNNFVPLLTPTVEGQVAAIIEANIEFSHITDNPAHQSYMIKYDAASEYFRRKNKFMLHFKDFARFYDLYGNCWVTVSWEKSLKESKFKPNGFPRIEIPPLLSVLVDGSIKDYKDLQYAEYIIREVGFQSIEWARRTYGDEKAEALTMGYNRYDGTDPDVTVDDQFRFTLLHVWTRNNEQGNLQLIEMDSNGFILRESDPSEAYYKNTDNEYPFYFCRMIPLIGQFYGYGDGMILKPMQETVNNLTDELELAARFSAQSKLAVDPKANMGAEQLDSNPANLIICNDPTQNIKILTGGGINAVVPQMIEFLLREAQRATRFSDIMTGNQQGVSATATQVSSQLRQGQVGIKDKKSDIAQAMEWADRYCLKLCLENWSLPFWASIGHDYQEYVDPALLGEAPAAIPLTVERADKIMARAKGQPVKMPKFEEVKGEDGELIMSEIDFDTKVVMGEGMANDTTSRYNILLGLAQMQVLDENGMPKPLITAKRLKELIEQLLGFKLNSEGEEDDDLQTAILNQQALLAQNPVGGSNTVQTPTSIPSNLMGTVPQMPNGDKRGLIL